MPKRNFASDIDLMENRLIAAGLEILDNLNLPVNPKEARFFYHQSKKQIAYFDGVELQYVINATQLEEVYGGLAWKDDVAAVADSDISIGALVNNIVIDGVTLPTGSRVLLMGQTDLTENGVWLVGDQIRATDLDSSTEFNNAVIQVSSGTTYTGWLFRCKTLNPIIGEDEIEFTDMTPSVPDASTTVKGKTAYATDVETVALTLGTKAVTPLGLSAVISPMQAILNAIVPPAPAGLAGQDLTIVGSYLALKAATGVEKLCIDNIDPITDSLTFYNGNAGTLTVEVDSVVQGTRALGTGSDVGTYGALNIVGDVDPYDVGVPGHGLYKQLLARVQKTGLTLVAHTYQMKHSLTGNSDLLTFSVDALLNTIITDEQLNVTAIAMVSGVYTIAEACDLQVEFTLENAVSDFYNKTTIAKIESILVATAYVAPPVTPPGIGTDIQVGVLEYEVLGGVYSEAPVVTITGYNAKGATTPYNFNILKRIDTVSDESTRKTAGTGQYPASGYNAAFNSYNSLKNDYPSELQLVNGRYKIPTGNYSAWGGVDYSSGMGSGDRWVLFNLGITLSSASSFIIEIPSILGTWEADAETAGLQVQVKVEGVTGWLNANAAYSVGSPVANGDACMVFADSDNNTKKVTFGGTPRTGVLLIRIGLPYNSDKSFGQFVTVSNIF